MMTLAWRFASLPLVLLVLQHTAADPRPDFAIKASIAGSAKVTSQTNQLAASFDKVDNTNFPLTAGYNLVNNMKTALLSISSQYTTAGTAITSALNTLTPNSSNNVDQLFQAVTDAISAFKTLLQSGFTSEFTTLQHSGHYITNMLIDGFTSTQTRLTMLADALGRLKVGVKAARDAPGNTATAVSSANLRKFVTTKMVTDVQDALVQLNAEAPLIEFINYAIQQRLVLADAYIIGIEQEARDTVLALTDGEGLFKDEVISIGETVGGGFVDIVAPVYGAQLEALAPIQAAIESISSYSGDLQPALDSLQLLLDTTVIDTLDSTITSAFADYNTNLDSSVAGASSIENFFVDEACGTLEQVVEALVASGVYAEYCFSKYSARVFNQFALTFYLLAECYEIEKVRLYRLQDLSSLVVDMIVYDIEDLGEAIGSCAPLTDGAPCLTLIGPYYEILATTIEDKQNFLLDYIDNELDLSLERLNACITASKYSMVIVLEPISSALATCTVSGYAA